MSCYEPYPTRRVPRLIAPTRAIHDEWMARDTSVIVPDGVLCFTLDRLFDGSMEYFIGDGVHKYSELMKYAGVPEAYTGTNISVMTHDNGLVDRTVLPHATATEYGVVKASVGGGAEQAILGDANGKYNFGDDATLDPSCLNSGVIPSGVTIPASQVTGMPDSVSYATNAGHANSADNATRATTAGTADTATNATNAGHATTADSADSADEADKLSTARRINVQMTVDGVQKGGYADFDGSGPITIDMGTVTTGGSSSADTSGLMPKPQTASGVGQTIRFGAVRGTGSAGATLPTGTLPNGGTWFIFGSHWVSDGTDADNWQEFFDFAFASGGTNIELITFNSGLSGGTSGNNMFTGLAIRIA